MANKFSFNQLIALGALGVLVAALTAWVNEMMGFTSINLPFFFLLLLFAPLSVVWFLLPAITVPLLVERVPVNRSSLRKLATFTLVPFLASGTYLIFASEYGSNDGRPGGVVALLAVFLLLTILAVIGFSNESRAVTATYHVVLSAWFVALAFPYLGEYP